MLKKIFIFCRNMAISFTIALLFGEVFIRIFIPQQESMKWFKSSEEYGYVVKKNFEQDYHYLGSEFTMHVSTNSMGLRDREFSENELKDGSKKRVLLIGDSFVFGHGVNMDDHFKTILQESLPSQYMVINAGVGGWGTLQEKNYCLDNLELFNPDVIVVTFCGNDPEDDVRFVNKLADNEKGAIYFPGKLFLKHNSHLYRFLYSKLHVILHNALLKQKKEESKLEIDTQSAALITTEEWARTLEYLESFFLKYREFNSSGIMILQPSAPWDENIRENLKSLSDQYPGIVFNDLFEQTKDLPEEKRVLPYDGHWSRELHVTYGNNLSNLILANEQ